VHDGDYKFLTHEMMLPEPKPRFKQKVAYRTGSVARAILVSTNDPDRKTVSCSALLRLAARRPAR